MSDIEIVKDSDYSTESLKSVKFLQVVTELLVVEFQGIYDKMSVFARELPKMFRDISARLTPALSLESMMEGKTCKSKVEMIKDEIHSIIDKNKDESKELIERLKKAKALVESLEREIPESDKLVDMTIVATLKLDQSFAEILFLNNSLMKLSDSAGELLEKLYNGDPKELDCTDKLSGIARLFPANEILEASTL